MNLIEQLAPFVSLTITLPAAAVMFTAYRRFRQDHFRAVFYVIAVAALFSGLQVSFLIAGPMQRNFAVAVELGRLSEVTLLLYLVVLPYFLLHSSPSGPVFAAINRALLRFGGVAAAAFAIVAYTFPDLFVSVTRLQLPGTAAQILWGSGLPGPMFHIWNAIIGAELIYMVIQLAITRRHGIHRTGQTAMFWGAVFAVVGAFAAIAQNFLLRPGGGLPMRIPFPCVQTGLAAFAFMSYWAALRRFFEEAKLTRKLQAELEQEVKQRRSYELTLKEHQEHLEELVDERTRDLKDAQQALVESEKMAVLGRLIATVSHEIRNPLGTVRNAVFSIHEGITSRNEERTMKAMELARRNIDRCQLIMDELLEYTRTREPSMQSLNADTWLNEALDELSIPEGITMQRELQGPVVVALDPNLLRLALINLCTNALQALQEEGARGSVVRVTSRLVEERWEVRVEDQGPGIPPEAQNRVFEPLFSTKSFGVGLGLAITRTIVEAHGGEVELSNVPDSGAVARLWIPRERSAQTAEVKV